MALIHCPDCEREVSSRAIACPQCAYPVQNLTNLMDATVQNDIDMLRDLLRAGKDPNEANDAGVTPLLVASQHGSLSATKLLLKAGADVNHQDINGLTPLMEAALQGYELVAKCLLEHGADPTLRNKESKTAREIALEGDRFEILALLDRSEEAPRQKREQPEVQSRPDKIPAEPVQETPVSRHVGATAADVVPEVIMTEPPPLPVDAKPKQRVRFIDDLAPIEEEEKVTGPELICKNCREKIAPEDIWCAHCKAPIIRRYCGGCHELIPEIAAQCPYCQSSKVNRFRYIRHLEQIVAGAAILGVLLFVLGIYNPQDNQSYAEKLSQQRSEQQEQKMDAEEKSAKRQKEQRIVKRTSTSSPTTPAIARVQPSEGNNGSPVLKARGTTEEQGRIPTVERIQTARNTGEPEEENEGSGNETSKPSRTVASVTERQPEPERSEPPEASPREESGKAYPAERLNAEGFRLMKSGRYTEAIPVLAQAVRSFPPGQKNLTYAYALYNLGRSLRLAGRPDLAIPILEERMKFANQREVVARELDRARNELNGTQSYENVEFE